MEPLDRWLVLLPAADPAAARAAGGDLLARWRQPHRHYHGEAHLNAVLDTVEILEAHAADPDGVRLAAWFHDAVHEGRAGDDEEASARLAEAVLPRLGVASSRVESVARLVRLTATHEPAPGDRDGAVLVDADLSVLGGSPQEYASYAAAVRAEYAALPDAAFRAGRTAVLQRLLDRDPLYRTSTARKRWEQSARRNVTAELHLPAT